MLISGNGKLLAGMSVTPFKFQGVSTMSQLKDYGLKRPSVSERATLKQMASDEQLAQSHEMRQLTNRRFDAARLARASLYAGYIERVELQGHMGGTPAITLWYPTPLVEADGGILIPYSAILTAIDGETQTEARYILGERNPGSLETPIAVTVYHGIEISAARTIVHDYNAYAKPVSESDTAAYNMEGPLTVAVNKALDSQGIEKSRVKLVGIKPSKQHQIAFRQPLMAAAGYQLNGGGLSRVINNTQLKQMNVAGNAEIDDAGVLVIQEFCKSALLNDGARNAPPLVWQVAGALVSQSQRQAGNISWATGTAAILKNREIVKGGVKLSPAERLANIAAAM